MFNHEPKNYICPFCQLVRGEPTEMGDQHEEVIFKNEHCTAFIAGKWWRANRGHVLIVPNEHWENLYDLPDHVGHEIFTLSKKVAMALKETYSCEGVSTRQHNEPEGDQSVWHFHLHVFPRYKGDDLYLNYEKGYWPTSEEKRPYVEKLKRYFEKEK